MSRRYALLAAVLAALVLVGLFFWPEPARADFGASARFGGGLGHAGAAGRVHSGDAGMRGGFRFGGRFGRGVHRGRGIHARKGATLGDRFRVFQRARLTGIPLPSFVPIGDAELIAQRRRLNAKFLERQRFRDRRFLHRKGRLGAQRRFFAEPIFFPWAPGVPGDDPPVIIVQVMPPAPAPVAPAAEPPQPLDPRGRIKVVGAEEAGAEGIVDGWSEGDVLPDSVPHVTLDYLAYGLPIPPLGEKYARVGNDVVRIDAGSRRIVEVVAR